MRGWFPSSPLTNHRGKSAGQAVGRRLARGFSLLGLLVLVPAVHAIDRQQAEAIPHVGQKARENFIQYIYAERHKAFAIAPGGAWAWSSTSASEPEAERIALERCQRNTEQRCVLYALNDEVVFDRQKWPRLWGPYLKATEAAAVPAGLARGARFPDLVFKDMKGKAHSLYELKGKVTVVHFWGSWCPPCLRELPVLQRFQSRLKRELDDKVAIIMLQVREPFSDSLAWVRRHQFDDLPLYDSGVRGGDDAELRVKNGPSLSDRQIARVFPTSYILDRSGIVLFVHRGPIADWDEYLPFLRDAAQRSGR